MSGKESLKQAVLDEERPKIYVTSRGARYVKADELLRSKRVRSEIDAMATLDIKQDSAATSSKHSKQKTDIFTLLGGLEVAT